MDFYRKKVFPSLAEALWLCFLFLDWTHMASSTWVKFAAICLCCVTALLGAKTADGKVVATALVFTLAADWFLLVRGDHYALGICLFIIVQFLYAWRLYLLRGKRTNASGCALRAAALFLILALFVVLLLFVVALRSWREGPPRDVPSLPQAIWQIFKSLLPLFYFSHLVVNTFEAFALGKSQRVFAWGLLLFICCDVCVGAFNLGLFTSFTWWGSWLFYLPSQVLIVLSQKEKAGDTQ